MRLITCSTGNWLPRIAPYLESLERHFTGDLVCLTVEGQAPQPFQERFARIKFAAMPAEAMAGAPEYSRSLQHGGFLDYLPGDEDELILFTDGDILLQRALTELEQSLLCVWTEASGAVAGWNSGPGETLAMEAARLLPRANVRELWGARVDNSCYNIGVFALRRSTYRRIYTRYLELWPKALETFGAPQRQQWLVGYVLAELGIPVVPMPYELHTHGCYALPPESNFDNGYLRYGNTVVAFRHHL